MSEGVESAREGPASRALALVTRYKIPLRLFAAALVVVGWLIGYSEPGSWVDSLAFRPYTRAVRALDKLKHEKLLTRLESGFFEIEAVVLEQVRQPQVMLLKIEALEVTPMLGFGSATAEVGVNYRLRLTELAGTSVEVGIMNLDRRLEQVYRGQARTIWSGVIVGVGVVIQILLAFV